MLPAPNSARRQMRASDSGFESAITQAGQLTADLLKQALSTLTSSMTALGNQANAFFAQLVASLAFERIARDTASFFGLAWPGLVAPPRQTGFASMWTAPVPEPSLYANFWLPGYSAAPAANPWALFAEAANMWTSFWLPVSAPKRTEATRLAPLAPSMSFPGFAWNFTFG